MITAILLFALLVWLFFHFAEKTTHEDGNDYWMYNTKKNSWGIVFRKKRKRKKNG